MDFLTGILTLGGWMAGSVILFRAWRRFPNRESKYAFVGFLLVFTSSVLILILGTILRVQGPSSRDLGAAFYFLGVPRLVGLVGTIMVVYVYWMIVSRARTLRLSKSEDEA